MQPAGRVPVSIVASPLRQPASPRPNRGQTCRIVDCPRGCYSFTEQVSQLKDKDDLAKYASELGVQESDNPAGSTHRHTLCT